VKESCLKEEVTHNAREDWIGVEAGTGSENLPYTSSGILTLGILFSHFL
jgi:hypothetical protein